MDEDIRPRLGPLLLVSLPHAMTELHLDGGGCLDSGHLCVTGYNEVLLFARISPEQMGHVLQFLTDEGLLNQPGSAHSEVPHPYLSYLPEAVSVSV